MKAVFPCKGVAVLSKKDIKDLENFYKSTLATSKLKSIYDTTEYMIQVGSFNYIPPKAKVILDEENLLTLAQLRSVMDGETQSITHTQIVDSVNNNVQKSSGTKDVNNSSNNNSNNKVIKNEKTISDEDILSHPFFTTLKPID